MPLTENQKESIEKMKRRLSVGMKGTFKFGGDGSIITKPIEFVENEDGTISYKIIGQRVLKKLDAVCTGIPEIPERIRTTVSTGKILQDGLIFWINSKCDDVIAKEYRKQCR